MKHARNVYHYQVKKCLKNEHMIRKNNLLNACINGNGNIFEEVKKMRKSKLTVASSVDRNSEKVKEHFKKRKLTNCYIIV